MVVQGKINSHRDLVVWQKSMDLVDRVDVAAESFPDREKFGMWSQLTRAAVSVPSNIAEGHARFSRKDFAYFVTVARASLMETETLIEVASRRGYVTAEQSATALSLSDEMSRMLHSLRKKLTAESNHRA